ncbi:hypothetical protein, partial [Vibrio breoganii]|uniref:hypothetical protein n=1 Tax=Vibrio breoganii TaxID=553239 RepID=UPI001A7E056E
QAIGFPIALKIPFVFDAFHAKILFFIILMIFVIPSKLPFARLILSLPIWVLDLRKTNHPLLTLCRQRRYHSLNSS